MIARGRGGAGAATRAIDRAPVGALPGVKKYLSSFCFVDAATEKLGSSPDVRLIPPPVHCAQYPRPFAESRHITGDTQPTGCAAGSEREEQETVRAATVGSPASAIAPQSDVQMMSRPVYG